MAEDIWSRIRLALFHREGEELGVQYGALPWRGGPQGVEILLITSRETGRWVIPKGWPMKGRRPWKAAAREAFEEAGAAGKPASEAIGAYEYLKRLKSGDDLPCVVTVYPLRVSNMRDKWPEKRQRTREWFGFRDAAEQVQEPELRELILAFGEGRARPH